MIPLKGDERHPSPCFAGSPPGFKDYRDKPQGEKQKSPPWREDLGGCSCGTIYMDVCE